MEYEILHDIPGRLRVHCHNVDRTDAIAEAIGQILATQDGVLSAALSVRTGNLLIAYSRLVPRRHILAILDVLSPEDWEGIGVGALPPRPRLFEMALGALFKTGVMTLLRYLLLPAPIRYATIVWEALPTIGKGVRSVFGGRTDIAVLDASALTILALRRDFTAMRTILLLFEAADALETWTREESRNSLAESLALKIDSVWVRTGRGEAKRPLTAVRPGDEVVVRTGTVIPVDGVAVDGEAMVNQSVLTGESEPSHKAPGISVFAGTVIDEGTLVIRVEKTADETRLNGIIQFIEESESLKAGIQSKAERLADAIVPYSLGLAALVFLITRSPIRASAVLMVDYSCAIRMSTPLSILSSIQEGVKNGVLIKGGKYLEALSMADCLVIDKTGTLTRAKPSVARVVGFAGWSSREVLRTAACIEEHFPHPVARAVVKKAEKEQLRHRERHAEPQYILAHGVVSRLNGSELLIGSAHFVFDDMRIPLSEAAARVREEEAALGRSLLFLAHDGQLVGLLAIEDPIREDAAPTLSGLRGSGIRGIHMLTGDGEQTARVVANSLDIADFHANLLPVDKARLIREFRKTGQQVMFVGDGVNDSPALSAANVGVSLKDGADIAKEVAGVVLVDGKLSGLLVARLLAVATLNRINWQFGFILGVNSLLIALGLTGGMTPRMAALLHNLATVLVTANSIRALLPDAAEASGDAVISMPAVADGTEEERFLLDDGSDVRFGSA